MLGSTFCRPALFVYVAALLVAPLFSQTVTVTPTSLAFGNQVQGTASGARTVTLKNGQTSAITITSIGTSLSDYAATSTCPASPTTLPKGASCTISVVFTPSALGTRSGTLSVVDSGTNSPQTVALSGTGTAPALVSIAVTPTSASIAAGLKQQFTATGTYSNGTTQNLTSAATWSSSKTSIATITTAGLATAVAQGSTTITAKSGTITGSATFTVTAAVLTSIAVTPATASVAAGNTQQFTATGTFSNGTTQNLSTTASWTSSAPSIATVSAGGLATSLVSGSATITATSGTISGSASLTVTAAVLKSIAVSPATASVAAGNTQQFTATGTFTNGSTQDLTSTATWTSSKTTVATVNGGGLATTVAQGSATITAKSGTISGSAALTVTAAVLKSIAVTPASASVAAGNTQQFTATGTFTNGTTQNLSSSVTWTSSSTSIATLSTSGLATGVIPGSVTVTAASGTISGTASLTVTTAVLKSIAVTPATASVAAGNAQQFTATGTYSNGTTQNLTSIASWTSSKPTIATINSAGLATSVAQGSASITATSGTITGSATLTVTAAALTSIAVTPPTASVAAGFTQQFTATGTYSNGTTQNLTSTATWTSSKPAIATVSGGLATSLAQGSATMIAKVGTISGSATLTVTAAVLTSIAITPGTASVPAGNTQQFTATGTYSNGTTQNLTTSATWTSSSTATATIPAHTGLATAVVVGTTTITATSGTIQGSAALTVIPAVLTAIAVTPGTASIAAGNTQQFTATGTYSDGTTQNLTGTANWTSSASSIATVVSGLATSVAQGSTNITATSGSFSGSSSLTVTPPVLISLAVGPSTASIAKGNSQQFTATGTYSDGSTQDLTAAVSWSSSPATVATISSGGLANGVSVGTATVTAASGPITASATLNVGTAVLVSLALTPANPSLALGTTLPLVATGTYSDGGTLVLTTGVTWDTTDSGIATVDGQGIVTSVAVGSTGVSATSNGITGSTSLTISPAVLVSIAITPAIPTLPLGTTQAFTATGTYTNGSTQDITATVDWTTDAPAVMTVTTGQPTPGIGSAVTQGTATVTATSGSVTGSTTATVTSAALVSLTITPGTPSIALGTMQQFTATGTFTDGSTQDLTSTSTWMSGAPAIATIDSTGLARSASIGTSAINATSGSVTSSTQLTVTPASLVSITIDPPSAAVPLGAPQQFTATGTFTDGTTQDLTQSGHWSSTVAGVATISNTVSTAGLASTLGTGTTTIGVSSGSVNQSATLTVNPAVLASIAITPADSSIALGTSQQFVATGTYTDGMTQDLTTTATWDSSSATVAIISNAVGSNGLATSSGQGTATITATSGSISNSTSLTVAGAALISISIAPAGGSIPLGTTQQFTATGHYTDGSTQDLTSTATWASSSGVVAPVSVGLVSGNMLGAASISASSGSVSNSVNVSVTAPVLVALTVSPGSASIAKGKSQQFTATATYSDGSTQDLTSAVSWSSSSDALATIGGDGLASGVGVGTVTITAAAGSITASATLNVGQAILVSVTVTPANPAFALGTTLPLVATGTYSDGSTLVLSNGVTWSTTDPGVATVDGQGIAASVSLGSTTVKATSNGITGTTNLTISPAVLVSIAVTPAIPTLPLGTTQPFTATGSYTDGSTQDITATVDWSTDAPAVMTIGTGSPTPGVANTLGQGTATVTATSGSVSGSTTATVTSAALVSLVITPAAPSIALGTTQQFTATGTFTDNSTQDLTTASTWTSDTTTTATINNTGLAQSVVVGSATITATNGTVSASSLLTVTTAQLISIAINPPLAAVPLGAPQQFTAVGTFTDGTTQDITQSAHWSSTVSAVATISNTAATAGLASTLATGSTTIGVSSGSVNQSATLTVNPAVLASIAITPAEPSIALGTTEQFVATGTYTDGTTQDVTTTAIWSSSSSAVAIISNAIGSNGLATSSGQGTVTITATSGSINGTTSLTVGQANLFSIAVTPASISIALGYGEQFAATATYSDGSTQDITRSVTWSSSAPGLATVNSSGYATSLAPGMTTISATSGSVSGGAVLTVAAPVPVSLAISPPSSSVFIGVQQQFSATLTYSDGTVVNVTNSVSWSSSNPAVATLNSGTGLALGIAGGSSAIEATWGSNLLTASASLAVSPPTVAITPAAAAVAISGSQQFSATVSGSANQSVNWSVDGVPGGSSTLGTISTNGLYTASPLIGTHSITATAQVNSASQGTATLSVGSSPPIPETYFGMHLHLLTSPVPSSMGGTGRIWDSSAAQWPNLNTASNTFTWTSLDSVLANYKRAGINDVMYTLWRVPNWASSNKTDATCDYANLGTSFYGSCDLPADINPDGSGTNLIWRTWVQNIAQHVNSSGYRDTHAHVAYWEACNECFRSPTLTPGYTTGSGSSVAYRGTYAQLVRLMQDARCIIIGNPSDPITALNTTCGQAGYSMIGLDPSSQMVMPSAGTGRQTGQTPPYAQASQNLLYCTCANHSCSASTTGCPTGSAGSAAVDVLNIHVYPKNFPPEQIPTQVATVRTYFNPAELAKPFWNGEGSWGQNASSTYINNGDADLEVAFVARFEIMTWVSGLTRSYWYQWDNSASGTLWNPTSNAYCSTPYATGYLCKSGVAYQQVHDWLVGSTLGACSATGTTWTCTLTQASGAQAAIMWDTSQTCSGGSCTAPQRTVSSTYFHYSDLTGASFPISGSAPVGIKPILLQGP